MSGNPSGFVHYLYRLERNLDTAALAKWRRGMGDSFGEISSAVYPELARYCDDPAHYGRYALVGTLIARHRLYTPERESLGTTFNNKPLGRSDSLDKRFKTLLAARGDEVIVRLREAVGLAKSHEVAIDFVSLLYDLLSWEDDNQTVQLRWAREYWFDAALRVHREKAVQIALEKESERRKAAHQPEKLPDEKERDARIFAGYLQSLQKNRAVWADLRQGLGRLWGTVDMLPHLAAFLPEQRRWEYPAYFLCAGLFGLHPLATDDAGHDMGRVFRFLGLQQAGKEASQSLQRRFTALLDADRHDLPHHLRQAISQAKSAKTPVAINYWRLLLDIIDWDRADKSVQRRWAGHFYFEKIPI